MRPLKDLWSGVRRHAGRTAWQMFLAFSVLWTLTEALNNFVPGIKIEGLIPLAAIIIASVCYGLERVWKPSSIEIKVANSNTYIQVLFGDLFHQEGIRAIAVNEFFDSALGKPVSEKSLHGVFLNRCFGGHPEPFDKQVEHELEAVSHDVVPRAEGKTKKYPIGATAVITAEKDRYIVFALTNTDPSTCKASADVTMMWVALHKLWVRSRVECGGSSLNLPLVGSGLAGIGLPTRDLLNLIILSAITETKAKPITQRIRIVLARDRFEEIDLRDVKRHWET